MRRVHRQIFMQAALVISIALSVAALRALPTSAAICGDKGFGFVNMGSQSFVAAGSANTSYKIWSRMQGPATSTYLLQVGSTCYEIGGSGLSTSAWTWTDRIDGASKTVTITGSQNVTLYGTADGVLLDRIIFTQATDGPCTQANLTSTNNGDACAAYSGTVPNNPPSLTFSATPASGTAPLSVSLSYSASDSDGTIASRSLTRSLNGGAVSSLTVSGNGTITDTLSIAGTYTYTATATDNSGATTTRTATVTASAVRKPGDANGDGQVGGADFSILNFNWGKANPTFNEGDFNGDGQVGGADFSILNFNWGR